MEQYPPKNESVKNAQPTAEVIQKAREALIEGFNNYSLELGDNFEHPGVKTVNELINGDTLFSEDDFNDLKTMLDFTNVDITLLWCSWLRECETPEDLESEWEKTRERLDELKKSRDDHDYFRVASVIKRFYGKMLAKLENTQTPNPPPNPPAQPRRMME